MTEEIDVMMQSMKINDTPENRSTLASMAGRFTRDKNTADRLAKLVTKRKRDEDNQRTEDSAKRSRGCMKNWLD